mgnify:CR=1 FL=1
MKLHLSYLPNLPHIRFLFWCCLSAGSIAPATLFAAPNPTEIRMQQDIQQRQREEQLRKIRQPETFAKPQNNSFVLRFSLFQHKHNKIKQNNHTNLTITAHFQIVYYL